MRVAVLKALNDIYTKYTIKHGKPTSFVSWANCHDRDITDGGFELSVLDKHICLYIDEGTLYIHQSDFVFFHNGGGREMWIIESDLTEEEHFQESTINYLPAQFDYSDIAEIKKYYELII